MSGEASSSRRRLNPSAPLTLASKVSPGWWLLASDWKRRRSPTQVVTGKQATAFG